MEETSPRKRREDQKSIQSNEPKTTSLQKEVRWLLNRSSQAGGAWSWGAGRERPPTSDL